MYISGTIGLTIRGYHGVTIFIAYSIILSGNMKRRCVKAGLETPYSFLLRTLSVLGLKGVLALLSFGRLYGRRLRYMILILRL